MKNLRNIIALLALLLTGLAALAATPVELLNQSAAKLRSAKTIHASFSMTSQGTTASGTLLCKGNKFAMSLPGIGTWYDGKVIWSYTRKTGEATVWKPTTAELAESNPLLYLSSAKDYTVKEDAKGVGKGVKTLVLTPKKRNTGVKSLRIVINTGSLLPKSISIAASSGNFKFNITSLKLNTPISDSAFCFDRKKYPKAQIVDLR